jgi:hypothetical protein
MAFYHVRIILSDSRSPEGIREFTTISPKALTMDEQDQEAHAHFLSAATETMGKDRVWGISCKRIIEVASPREPLLDLKAPRTHQNDQADVKNEVPARVILKTKKGPGKYRSGPGGHPDIDWGKNLRQKDPSTP